MHLDFPVPKGPLGPSTPHTMSANHPQKAHESARSCTYWPLTATNQEPTISWATWLKM